MYNWENLRQLFIRLNEKCHYLILRNFEEIYSESFLKDHPDVDFLCDNADSLIEVSKAFPRDAKSDRIHYYILIDHRKVPIDIRETGDGYYDRKWEKEMLEKRIMSPQGFYIMDEENYFYSLLYHSQIHKKTVSDDYRKRLHEMANRQKIEYGEETGIKTLENFMRNKGYKYTYPVSPGGIMNLKGTDKSLRTYDLKKIAGRNIYTVRNRIARLIRNGR